MKRWSLPAVFTKHKYSEPEISPPEIQMKICMLTLIFIKSFPHNKKLRKKKRKQTKPVTNGKIGKKTQNEILYNSKNKYRNKSQKHFTEKYIKIDTYRSTHYI